MATNNIEMRDDAGNVYYPHTDAAVVFRDGAPVGALIPFVFTHAKAATVHTLTGLTASAGVVQASFTATADYMAGDTFQVGAEVYTAKLQGEDGALTDKYFVTGDLVSVLIDVGGKRLGFKAGGGGGGDEPINIMALPDYPKIVTVGKIIVLSSIPATVTRIIHPSTALDPPIQGEVRILIGRGSDHPMYPFKLKNIEFPIGDTTQYQSGRWCQMNAGIGDRKSGVDSWIAFSRNATGH